MKKRQVAKTEKKITINQLSKQVSEQIHQLSDLVESLAQATAKGFQEIRTELNDFKSETRENFARIRRNIFEIKDTYATKKELQEVVVRVETLERK